MRNPIYQLHLRVLWSLLKPEETDDPINIDCQQRLVEGRGMAIGLADTQNGGLIRPPFVRTRA
ncbi:MAG TPA: hypothetical protein VNC16_01285, partial [Solirubrobacterales bacterium]|nr:hypothetical protein [Solirubrobacterales bacterium]